MPAKIDMSPDISDTVESSDPRKEERSEAEIKGKEIVTVVTEKITVVTEQMSQKLYEVVGKGAIAAEKGVGFFKLGLEKIDNTFTRFGEWVNNAEEAVENKVDEIQYKTSTSWDIFKDKVKLWAVKPFADFERRIRERKIEREERRANKAKEREDRRLNQELRDPSKDLNKTEQGIDKVEAEIDALKAKLEALKEKRAAINGRIEAIQRDSDERKRDIDESLRLVTDDLQKTTDAENIVNRIKSRMDARKEEMEERYPSKKTDSKKKTGAVYD